MPVKSITKILAVGVVLLGLLLSNPLPVSAQPSADYGDAPDPTYPSLYNTTSTSYPNRRGPYHLDVSQEWIGTSSVSTTTVEGDALVPDLDFDDGAIQLLRLLISGSPVGQGYVIVPISISATSDYRVRYLNVAADLDQNGIWQAYSVGLATQQEWIVPNLAIYTEPGTSVNVIVPFPLVDPGITPPDQIWVRATFATEYIDPSVFGANGWDGSGPDQGFLRGETEDTRVTVADHDGWFVPPGCPPGGPGEPSWPLPDPQPGLPPPRGAPARGNEKEGVPDMSQPEGSMECGPYAAANSLYYLAGAYGFDLPDDPQEVIDELKRKMRPDWNQIDPFPGAWPNQFREGKERTIEQRDMDVETHCEWNPTIGWIAREIDRCEDVEILLCFDGGG